MRQFLRRLATYLDELNTDPKLHTAILDSLTSWFFNKLVEEVFQHSIQFKQENIGWLPFLKGFWHLNWARAQHRYLQKHDMASRTNISQQWMHKLQVFILQRMYKLWTDSCNPPTDRGSYGFTYSSRQQNQRITNKAP